jgi:hypothetical protein
MFSKEESKQLRHEFWDRFQKISARKRLKIHKDPNWIMNNTGMRQLKLKFYFDEQMATVGIDVETRNIDKRIDIFGKLERLKSKLENTLGDTLFWELDYPLPSGKSISRTYLKMENVNIYEKNDWEKVIRFLFDKMTVIEEVFIEYKDYLKYSELGE